MSNPRFPTKFLQLRVKTRKLLRALERGRFPDIKKAADEAQVALDGTAMYRADYEGNCVHGK